MSLHLSFHSSESLSEFSASPRSDEGVGGRSALILSAFDFAFLRGDGRVLAALSPASRVIGSGGTFLGRRARLSLGSKSGGGVPEEDDGPLRELSGHESFAAAEAARARLVAVVSGYSFRYDGMTGIGAFAWKLFDRPASRECRG